MFRHAPITVPAAAVCAATRQTFDREEIQTLKDNAGHAEASLTAGLYVLLMGRSITTSAPDPEADKLRAESEQAIACVNAALCILRGRGRPVIASTGGGDE